MEMVNNGESYLWIKAQFATYILGSPASMYGPVYDDLFKKTRLTNLLMVALIADGGVTLDNFVNMRYTKAGAYNWSPRRVLTGGPVRPNWDQPLNTRTLWLTAHTFRTRLCCGGSSTVCHGRRVSLHRSLSAAWVLKDKG